METHRQERYSKRQEEDGTWTVFDTTMPVGRENRIMTGISEERAGRYLGRLNLKVTVAQTARVTAEHLATRYGEDPEELA